MEVFSAAILEEISPFVVDFELTTTTAKTSRTGGSYDSYNIVVKSARYTNRFRITGVTKTDYEKMRLLRLQGLIKLAVSKGVPKKEGAYAPIIISGVPA